MVRFVADLKFYKVSKYFIIQKNLDLLVFSSVGSSAGEQPVFRCKYLHVIIIIIVTMLNM